MPCFVFVDCFSIEENKIEEVLTKGIFLKKGWSIIDWTSETKSSRRKLKIFLKFSIKRISDIEPISLRRKVECYFLVHLQSRCKYVAIVWIYDLVSTLSTLVRVHVSCGCSNVRVQACVQVCVYVYLFQWFARDGKQRSERGGAWPVAKEGGGEKCACWPRRLLLLGLSPWPCFPSWCASSLQPLLILEFPSSFSYPASSFCSLVFIWQDRSRRTMSNEEKEKGRRKERQKKIYK